MSKEIMTTTSAGRSIVQNFETKTPKTPVKYIEALFDKCEQPQQDFTEIKKSLSDLFRPGVLFSVIKERESLLKLLMTLHTSLRILIQNKLLSFAETHHDYYAKFTQLETNTEILKNLLSPHELAEFYSEIADTYNLFYPDLNSISQAQNWYLASLKIESTSVVQDKLIRLSLGLSLSLLATNFPKIDQCYQPKWFKKMALLPMQTKFPSQDLWEYDSATFYLIPNTSLPDVKTSPSIMVYWIKNQQLCHRLLSCTEIKEFKKLTFPKPNEKIMIIDNSHGIDRDLIDKIALFCDCAPVTITRKVSSMNEIENICQKNNNTFYHMLYRTHGSSPKGQWQFAYFNPFTKNTQVIDLLDEKVKFAWRNNPDLKNTNPEEWDAGIAQTQILREVAQYGWRHYILGMANAIWSKTEPFLNQLSALGLDYDIIIKEFYRHFFPLFSTMQETWIEEIDDLNFLDPHEIPNLTIKYIQWLSRWRSHHQYELVEKACEILLSSPVIASHFTKIEEILEIHLEARENKKKKHVPPPLTLVKDPSLLTDWRQINIACQEVLTIEAQSDFNNKIRSLLVQEIKLCTEILGPPPRNFNVIALGSLAQDSLAPHSDLDIALLLPNGDDEYRTHPYWKQLIFLLNNRLTTLSKSDYLTIDPGDLALMGFHEEQKQIERIGDNERYLLLNTGKNWLEFLMQCSSDHNLEEKYFELRQSLYRPALLYAHNKDHQPFIEYLTDLTRQLQLSTKEKFLYPIAVRDWKILHQQWRQTRKRLKEEPFINLKKDLLRPIDAWIRILGFYAGITQDDNRVSKASFTLSLPDLLSRLSMKPKPILSPVFTAIIREIFYRLQQLRLQLHHENKAANFHVKTNINTDWHNCIVKPEDKTTSGMPPDTILTRLKDADWRWMQHTIIIINTLFQTNLHQIDEKNSLIFTIDPIFFSSKQSHSKIKARIDMLIDLCSSLDIEDPEIYTHYFRQLITQYRAQQYEELANYYYTQLAIYLPRHRFSESQQKCITKAVGNTPLPNGIRHINQQSQREWQLQWATLWCEKNDSNIEEAAKKQYQEKNLPLIWIEGLPRLSEEKVQEQKTPNRLLLKPEVAGYWLNNFGEWQYHDLPGRRRVLAYPNLTAPICYLKILPELPGMELAIQLLASSIIGQRATPFIQLIKVTIEEKSTLFKWQKKHPQPYPVLISEAIQQSRQVPGRHLEAAFLSSTHTEAERNQRAREIEGQLNPKQFAQWIFLTILTHPEDGTAHNFVLYDGDIQPKKIQPFNKEHKYSTEQETAYLELASVDNDHVFVQPFVKQGKDRAYSKRRLEEKQTVPKDNYATLTLQIKSILYCFNRMRLPLDASAVTEFLLLDPDKVLTPWLQELANFDHQVELLIPSDLKKYYLGQDDSSFVYAHPVFGENTISKLYQTWRRIQRALLDINNPVKTPLHLLEKVHPLIGRHYRALHEGRGKNLSPISRMKQLTDELKRLPNLHIPSSTRGKDVLKVMDSPQQKSLFQQIKDAIRSTEQKSLLQQPENKNSSEIQHQSGRADEEKYVCCDLKLIQKELKECITAHMALPNEINTLKDLKAHNISIQGLPAFLKSQKKFPDFISKLVAHIPFKEIDLSNQTLIIELLAEGQKYDFLILENLKIGIDLLSRVVAHSRDLRYLSLKGSTSVVGYFFMHQLSIFCPMLEKLVVSDTKLDGLFQRNPYPPSTLQALEFSHLLTLDVNRCSRLQIIYLRAPKLLILNAKKCVQLAQINLQTPELMSLEIIGSSTLRELQFNCLQDAQKFTLWQTKWNNTSLDPSSEYRFSQLRLGLAWLFLSNQILAVDNEQARYWWDEYKRSDPEGKLAKHMIMEVQGLTVIHYLATDLTYARNLISLMKVPKLESPAKSPLEKLAYILWLYAAEHDYLSWLQRLVNLNTLAHLHIQRNDSGDTILHIALTKGHDDIIDFCLQPEQACFYINSKGHNNHTPFLRAAYYGRVKWIEKMQIIFPDQNFWYERDLTGQTALHLALKQNQSSVIALAIQNNELLKAKDLDGNTPFLVAAANGHDAALLAMLESKNETAIWKDQNRRGETAFWLAVINKKDLDIYQQKQLIDFNAKDYLGNTIFLQAILHKKIGIVKYMLEQLSIYPLLEQTTFFGTNVLMRALAAGHDGITVLIFDHLLRRQTTPAFQVMMQKNKDGWTALHTAAYYNCKDWIKPLVQDLKFSVNALDNVGASPALLAAQNGHLETLKLLIENHAEINLQDNHGDNVLTVAQFNQQQSVVEWLQQRGLQNLLQSESKLTSSSAGLSTSSEKENLLERLSILTTHRDSIVRQLQDGAQHGKLDKELENTLKRILEIENVLKEQKENKSDNLIKLGSQKWTTLPSVRQSMYIAVQQGDLKKLQILLRQSSIKFSHVVFTLLKEALGNNRVNIVDWLLARRAENTTKKYLLNDSHLFLLAASLGLKDYVLKFARMGIAVDCRDSNLNTALILAIIAGHVSMVEFLIETLKVSLTDADKDGKNPLLVAICEGQANITKYLCTHGMRLNFHILRTSQKLSSLNFSGCTFNDIDMSEIIQQLTHNSNVKTIYLEHTEADQSTLQTALTLVTQNPNIIEMTLPKSLEMKFSENFSLLQQRLKSNNLLPFQRRLYYWSSCLAVLYYIHRSQLSAGHHELWLKIMNEVSAYLNWPRQIIAHAPIQQMLRFGITAKPKTSPPDKSFLHYNL